MRCFFCPTPTDPGVVRCKKCYNAVLKDEFSYAKRAEIKKKVKAIDDFQRHHNTNV